MGDCKITFGPDGIISKSCSDGSSMSYALGDKIETMNTWYSNGSLNESFVKTYSDNQTMADKLYSDTSLYHQFNMCTSGNDYLGAEAVATVTSDADSYYILRCNEDQSLCREMLYMNGETTETRTETDTETGVSTITTTVTNNSTGESKTTVTTSTNSSSGSDSSDDNNDNDNDTDDETPDTGEDDTGKPVQPGSDQDHSYRKPLTWEEILSALEKKWNQNINPGQDDSGRRKAVPVTIEEILEAIRKKIDQNINWGHDGGRKVYFEITEKDIEKVWLKVVGSKISTAANLAVNNYLTVLDKGERGRIVSVQRPNGGIRFTAQHLKGQLSKVSRLTAERRRRSEKTYLTRARNMLHKCGIVFAYEKDFDQKMSSAYQGLMSYTQKTIRDMGKITAGKLENTVTGQLENTHIDIRDPEIKELSVSIKNPAGQRIKGATAAIKQRK